MNQRLQKRIVLLFRHIGLLFFTIIALFPLVWAITSSFKPKRELFRYPPDWIPDQITIEHYQYVLRWTNIPLYFLNSIIIGTVTILFVVFISALGAYAFSKLKFPAKNVFFIAVLATQMIPGLTNLIPLYFIIQKLGLMNTKIGIILIYIASGIPLGIWILRGFFDKVPSDLRDAARIDGCSRFATFYKIFLPLSRPGLAAVALFVFLNTWNEFPVALTMTSGPENRPISVGLFEFIGARLTDHGGINAAAVLAFVPIVIVYIVLQKHFVSGLTGGAVKG